MRTSKQFQGYRHANPDDHHRRFMASEPAANYDDCSRAIAHVEQSEDDEVVEYSSDFGVSFDFSADSAEDVEEDVGEINFSELPHEDNPWNHLRKMNPVRRRSREKPTRRDNRAANLLRALAPERRVNGRLSHGRKYTVGVNTIVYEFRALRHSGDFASCVQRCLKAT